MTSKSNFFQIRILIVLVVAAFTFLYFVNIYDFNHIFALNHLNQPNGPKINKDSEDQEPDTDKYRPNIDDFTENEPENKSSTCEKWLVITSISEPTDHVKYLQDALFDWCLVVLGDSKSPPDWKYKNAIFLSLRDQINLSERYRIVSSIPTKSYLRKMVGYLYAIDQGAIYIYETDDDNSALDGLLGFRYTEFRGLEMNCEPESMFINPYAYFGQPSVWPRGYPLEMISENSPSYNCSRFRISSDLPLIQQGLVNGDPDVDAIYRLTRKQPSKPLDIEFDSTSPPLVLKRRQYAPTNSQNTFFHYDSFWSLIFPRNVTFREVDILRGYISIRMLQEIDGRVSYLAPNAVQMRNAHSYHKDYLQEKRLYESIFRFVSDLDEWNCEYEQEADDMDYNQFGNGKKTHITLKECFIQCIRMLVEKKHFDESEIQFYQLWINDLDSIGYKWPEVKPNRDRNSSNWTRNIYFKSIEQDHSSNSNDNEKSIVQGRSDELKLNKLKTFCSLDIDKKLELKQISDLILVTWVTNKEDIDLVNVINVHFKFIVACFGSLGINIDEYILTNTSGGVTLIQSVNFKECVFNVVNIGFKQNSFIFVKNLARFEFWRNDLRLVEPQSDEFVKISQPSENEKEKNLLETNIYFVRKTVANGQRFISPFGSNNVFNFSSYCSMFLSKTYKTWMANLNEVIKSPNWHSNDLVGESCSNIDSRTIWIPDFHDGPRVDISSTLVHLGQNPILAGYKGAGSPYPKALKQAKISNQLSNFIKTHRTVSVRELKESQVRENFEFYRKNADFVAVDAVICSFIASMCEAFIPLNKTIIFSPAHRVSKRYNIGRCDKSSWSRLNENYQILKKKSKIIVSATSRYDEEYQYHFTGLRGFKLYAQGSFYANEIQYEPTKREILVGPTNGFGVGGDVWFKEIRELGKTSKLDFKTIREAYPARYELSDLAKHPAVVIFPYAVMSYSIVDFYISNLPIFVPSIEMLVSTRSLYDRSVYLNAYCGKFEPIEPHPQSIHAKFDPNSEAEADYRYWLQYADYYRWPFVTVFHNASDLIQKLQNLDLRKISNSMKEFNLVRQAYVLDNWCRLIKRLPKEQPIPETYQAALSYLGVDSVQVFSN